MGELERVDPEVHSAIVAEEARQRGVLELIASENFASRAVMEAAGTCLTNKYAEGYPGRRYYGGCEFIDLVEDLARNRARALFRADHANVQPHSGTQANMAVYFACLKPGDAVLGMDLAHGGHLTHGSPVNISGRYFRFFSYGVDPETEQVDYDEVERLARASGARLIVAGASAYPRILDFERFGRIAQATGALLMVDMAHIAGLVAAGEHPSPVPHAQFVTSTTHKTLRGPRGGFILCRGDWAQEVDKAVFPGTQGGPLEHIIAAKAVAFKEASTPEFVAYQRQVRANARALAAALTDLGLRLVAGGTDTHLVLVDLTPLGLAGREAEEVLERVGITVNKNAIPFDRRGPTVTSGIRLGTPAATTRGMKEPEMRLIAEFIYRALARRDDEGELRRLRDQVRDLVAPFPWPQAG
ncbi:MAG: serine hydroxymethyltransferase [Acetobacteraceae bacterium]|nr:serine hydroxymethyltransferase [Acetobacteraceae bacterium]